MQEHWEQVYRTRSADAVSWYQPHAQQSLRWIAAAGLDADDGIIDVGGGASTLVDDLLDEGYRALTVLDLSAAALAVTRRRLGERAASVRWIVGDVTTVALPERAYALWHDRAVFHFLIEEDARAAYLAQLRRALRPGGHLIVATFGPDGPTRCSGLPVARYSPESLQAVLGADFQWLEHAREEHRTPAGAIQSFNYCRFIRSAI